MFIQPKICIKHGRNVIGDCFSIGSGEDLVNKKVHVNFAKGRKRSGFNPAGAVPRADFANAKSGFNSPSFVVQQPNAFHLLMSAAVMMINGPFNMGKPAYWQRLRDRGVLLTLKTSKVVYRD